MVPHCFSSTSATYLAPAHNPHSMVLAPVVRRPKQCKYLAERSQPCDVGTKEYDVKGRAVILLSKQVGTYQIVVR